MGNYWCFQKCNLGTIPLTQDQYDYVHDYQQRKFKLQLWTVLISNNSNNVFIKSLKSRPYLVTLYSVQGYQHRIRLQRRLCGIYSGCFFIIMIFFAKSLNKPFKTHIQGIQLNLNLGSSYLVQVLFINFNYNVHCT